MTEPATPTLKLKLQIFLGDEIAMGPGKAALIAAIDEYGSISGAARALGMSYRRAWQLADTLNRCFAAPVIATRPGGGASVTAQGLALAEAYRRLVEHTGPLAEDDAYGLIAGAMRQD